MNNNIRQNSLKAWILAARPKTLSGAMVPVCIGASLAYANHSFGVAETALCAAFAAIMQIAANFINDLYDYKKGTDREDRLGPERACAQGWISEQAMEFGIGAAILLACAVGCVLLATVYDAVPLGGWELVAVGAVSVVFAFLYTTYLSYRGWGDLLVLIFFGFIPVCGTYYVQAHSLSIAAVVASLISGLTIDTLLVVNNFRDREQDRISGKMTIVVRLGETFGKYLYLILGVVAAIIPLYFLLMGEITLSGFLTAPVVYLYLHLLTWRKMVKINKGKELNRILGETSRNILLYGLLLSIAFILG